MIIYDKNSNDMSEIKYFQKTVIDIQYNNIVFLIIVEEFI